METEVAMEIETEMEMKMEMAWNLSGMVWHGMAWNEKVEMGI
jgi:hypothetical protein